MNSEERFARVRIRGALAALEDAGLSAARIADAANHLARARVALETVTDAVLARAAVNDPPRSYEARGAGARRRAARGRSLRALA